MSRKAGTRIAVFCSGNGSNLQALIDARRRGGLKAEIALVLCDRADAYAIVRANRHSIPVALLSRGDFDSRAGFEKAALGILKKAGVKLVVLAGFMRILGPDFVRAYPDRILNIHPALLPAFKGAHGVRDAKAYGVKVTGVTVHFVTEDLDDGPVILQEAVAVRADDTEASLLKRVHKVEHRLYPKAVRLFAEGRLKVRGRKVLVK